MAMVTETFDRPIDGKVLPIALSIGQHASFPTLQVLTIDSVTGIKDSGSSLFPGPTIYDAGGHAQGVSAKFTLNIPVFTLEFRYQCLKHSAGSAGTDAIVAAYLDESEQVLGTKKVHTEEAEEGGGSVQFSLGSLKSDPYQKKIRYVTLRTVRSAYVNAFTMTF